MISLVTVLVFRRVILSFLPVLWIFYYFRVLILLSESNIFPIISFSHHFDSLPFYFGILFFFCLTITLALIDVMCFLLQNMYAQLLPLALPAPPMQGMGGVPGMGGFAPPPGMVGMGMPPMPPYGMPPMGSSY